MASTCMHRTWQEYMAFSRFLLVHTYQQGVHLWDHLLPLWPPVSSNTIGNRTRDCSACNQPRHRIMSFKIIFLHKSTQLGTRRQMAARIDRSAVEFRRGFIPDTSSEQYSYRRLLCLPRLDCSWSGMSWKALEVSSFLLQWSDLP